MIASKCVYSARSEGDGTRILVARFVPKNITDTLVNAWDVFIPDAAPSPVTLRQYRDKLIKFPEYTGIYLQELLDSMDAVIAIKTLASLAIVGPITLLCYEKIDTFCHRRFVKEMIERYQLECQYDIEAIWRSDPREVMRAMKKDYSRHIRSENKESKKVAAEEKSGE